MSNMHQPAERIFEPLMGFDVVRVRTFGDESLSCDAAWLVCESGHNGRNGLWYEGNIYLRRDGSYLLEIKCFQKGADASDAASTFRCETLDEVVALLRRYDARQDLLLNIDAKRLASNPQWVVDAMAEARTEFSRLESLLLTQIELMRGAKVDLPV